MIWWSSEIKISKIIDVLNVVFLQLKKIIWVNDVWCEWERNSVSCMVFILIFEVINIHTSKVRQMVRV